MKMKTTILTTGLMVGSALLLSNCKKDSGGSSDGDSSGADKGSASATGVELVEVTPEWPEAEFQGTPVPLKDTPPNFEKPGKPRKTIMLPEGAVNVALGKAVTASNDPFIGDLELVTDGDAAGGDGFYIEMDPGKQWIQVDLEKEETIHGLILWHYHKDARIYTDVVIVGSNDPEFKDGNVIIYNADHDDSLGLGYGKGSDNSYVETNHGRIIEKPEGVKARYVRLYSNGSSAGGMNNYVELSIYAVPEA